MAGERIERDQLVIRDATVLTRYPIHFAGAALLIRNEESEDNTIVVQESDDGITWTVVLISTHSDSGLLEATITSRSYRVILFTSAKPYVRLVPGLTEGQALYASLVQFPPKARDESTLYG